MQIREVRTAGHDSAGCRRIGAGSTAVAGGGLAANREEITRSTVSTDCVVKLEETTIVAGLTPAAPAAPKCARARLHSPFRRASVMETQFHWAGSRARPS